jgi:DNA-binding PadR family transcriptional regulator
MTPSEPRLTAQTLRVLGTLMSQTHDETSGAEIARLTNLASGTLYPILLRLEHAGWVESQWEAGDPSELGRPRRRFYQITTAGSSKAKSGFKEVARSFKEFAWRYLLLGCCCSPVL